jgi:hypothetical protein
LARIPGVLVQRGQLGQSLIGAVQAPVDRGGDRCRQDKRVLLRLLFRGRGIGNEAERRDRRASGKVVAVTTSKDGKMRLPNDGGRVQSWIAAVYAWAQDARGGES